MAKINFHGYEVPAFKPKYVQVQLTEMSLSVCTAPIYITYVIFYF